MKKGSEPAARAGPKTYFSIPHSTAGPPEPKGANPIRGVPAGRILRQILPNTPASVRGTAVFPAGISAPHTIVRIL
jgi:hypothetical protein